MVCPLSDIRSTVGHRGVIIQTARSVVAFGDGRRSGTAQTENTVRHTTYYRIRGMVVDDGGRSTGVLLYQQNCAPRDRPGIRSLDTIQYNSTLLSGKREICVQRSNKTVYKIQW